MPNALREAHRSSLDEIERIIVRGRRAPCREIPTLRGRVHDESGTGGSGAPLP